MTLSVPLKPHEKQVGFLYLLIELFLLPTVLELLNYYLQFPEWGLNFLFFCVNFLCVAIIFHRFLIRSFEVVLQNVWGWIRYSGQGLLLYFIGNLLIHWLFTMIAPDFANVNDATILQYAQENRLLMTIGTVLLVPIAEETLFRGLVFRSLFDRSTVLAYVVSSVIFSAIHVTGYIGAENPMTLLLCFIQYIPAGLSLAYAYHKADTVWASILMHAIINLIGMHIGG